MLKNHTNIWQKDRLGHGEASQKKTVLVHTSQHALMNFTLLVEIVNVFNNNKA